jgi:probable HAF family extracellular repeat protein
MKSRILVLIAATAVSIAVVMPIRLAAQNQRDQHEARYVVIDLGTLGGSQGVAEGISDRGWVVGDANLPGDQSGHATLWRNGVVTDLGTLGGINSQEQWPVKDSRGLIVGSAETANLDPFNEDFCGFDSNAGVPRSGLICQAFLWQDGMMSALPTLGGNNAQALGINDRGQIVGMAEQGTQLQHCTAPQALDIQAVVWGPRPGEMRTLPPLPGDISAWAIGINNAGQIVGVSGNCVSPNFNAPGGTTPQHAVIWQDGTVTNIGTLGGSFIFPWAINSKGQVTGQSSLPGDTSVHSFLWDKGAMTDLGVLPGHVATWAFGLNDRAEVVGGSIDQNGIPHAFLWKDGVITDVNSLVTPGSTSLYLIFGNDINSRGEIAFYAYDQNNGEFHAAMGIPCDEGHAPNKACQDADHSAIDVSDTIQHPKVVLPEYARQQLWRRIGTRLEQWTRGLGVAPRTR